MTEHDNELLSQYLDGELGASDQQALERRLAAEPALQAHLNDLRAVNGAVQSAFSAPGVEAVPAHIASMLERPASNVLAFPQRQRAAWGLAVAASLMVASGVLFFDQSWQDNSAVMPGNDTLAQVLEQRASRAEGWDQLADGSQMRPILSFQSVTGDWCREFLLESQAESWRGVACRQQGNWATRAIGIEQGVNTADQYRPAGSGNAIEVSNFVEAQADDIALSASQEAALIQSNWK